MANPNNFSHVLTMTEAKPHLEPLIPILEEGLRESWAWLQSILDQDPERRVVLDDTSTLASMLSNAFFYFVGPKLRASAGMEWGKKGRMQQGVVRDAICLRFKKLTPNLCSMNVDTDEQLKRYCQESLPGIRFLTQITFGYTLDRLARTVTGLYFVCPKNLGQNLWVWPLFETDGGTGLFAGGPFEDDGDDSSELNVEIAVAQKKVESA